MKMSLDKLFRKLMPKSLKLFVRRFFPKRSLKYLQAKAASENPFSDDEKFGEYKGDNKYTLGIIKEFTHYHKHYIAACRGLNVSYKVLDISGPNWVDVIRNSQCDGFLVWPSSMMTIWKQMYDERLRIMSLDMSKVIFPRYEALWMWQSKRRMWDWMVAHNVPCPKAWLFYRLEEAEQFLNKAKFPLVFKPDFGDIAKGIRILRSRKEALKHVRKVFSKGIRLPGAHPCDVQWGVVFLQEYLADVAEWRTIRIGNSYFGHQKLKKGDFHSGSGEVGWYDPPKKLLDFVREVTNMGGFNSMNLDIFETADGCYLVNELQSMFGTIRPYQMLVKGKAGRYLYDYDAKSWHFEEGVFCQNGCCNLRIETLVEMLGHQVELPKVDVDAAVSKEDRAASIRDWELRVSQQSE